MRFGIIGSGSWATALAKILTDNQQPVHWYVRSQKIVEHLTRRHHNPHYLSSVHFDNNLVQATTNLSEVFDNSDALVIAVPSAYVAATLEVVDATKYADRIFISAVKGIIPESNILLNQFLQEKFNVKDEDYFTVMGPCHAEEVAAEKLSYLTFSGKNINNVKDVATYFTTGYLNTIVNNDVTGVQYAAILKNIYAMGAGIAHGLEYGDNFLSVFIANAADEMAGFLRKSGIPNIEVGIHDTVDHRVSPNYAASVYLGDLLVTCYSLYSRNRTFGNMIGKGYSVSAAKLEMKMVAEGYNASRCMYAINKVVGAEMPIADAVYRILWEELNPAEGFALIEDVLV